MKTYCLHNITTLVQDFEQKLLPQNSWTHEAHIVLAAWYCFHFDEATAYEKMKQNIIAYNEVLGIANSESYGYHDTLTRFWLLLVYKFQHFHKCPGVTELVNGLLASGLAGKNFPLKFYAKKSLYSENARRRWLAPEKLPAYQLEILIDPASEPHFQLTDVELMTRFGDCSLNPTFFSHEAHLRLAYVYLKKYGPEQTIRHLTRDIQSFAQSLGSATKYHSTLTIAAIHVVDHFMRKSASPHFYAFTREFPRLKTHFKELIAQHYKEDIFNSETARSQYIAPDLLPFN